MGTPVNSIETSDIKRARTLARVLDSAVGIPGTRFRIGLDPLLGLLPGGGDLAGAVLSSYIVLLAARRGVPRAVVWRMVANVAFDSLLGTVPVLGDLFDAAYKSNARNVDLLERYVAEPQTETRRSRMLGAAAVVVILAVVIAFAAVSFVVMRWLWHLITT